jgi:allophanate hydrolase
VTRAIISPGRLIPATEAFAGQHRLAELRRATDEVWQSVDVLVTPTAATIYTIAAVEKDPIALNANLALYTNFTNLLDLASVAVPAGFRNDGLPFGISLSGPAWSDDSLLALAGRFQPLATRRLGALALETPP